MALGSRDHGQEKWEVEPKWRTGLEQQDSSDDDRAEILLQGQKEVMERISAEDLHDPFIRSTFRRIPLPLALFGE